MRAVLVIVFLSLIGNCRVICQPRLYLELEETRLSSFEGLHSGVGIKWKDYWVFIGGRQNGLHGFRPPLAFPTRSANDEIVIVDYKNDKAWTESMLDWDKELRQPLMSSNMQYAVKGDQLLICGGYGWDEDLDDFNTFSTLVMVDIDQLIAKVRNELSAESLFKRIEHSSFRVCGGNMGTLGDTCLLVFGHEFIGHYSRHNNGFFKQRYTNEIRRFMLDTANGLTVNWLPAERDTVNFHRRDYNLVPHMSTNGIYYTAYSGVFQYDVNLPFYTPIEMGQKSQKHVDDFQQRYSHYHSAVLPVYFKNEDVNQVYFFGGMAEYLIDSASSVEKQDTMVPFVKTISMVTRDRDGGYTEEVLKQQMPGFMGSNMWFFPVDGIGFYSGKVLNADYVQGKTLVGYLVGGIVSPYENISLVDPSISQACKRIYKVYLNDHNTSRPLTKSDAIQISIFPNPGSGQVFLSATLKGQKNLTLEVIDPNGKVIKTWEGSSGKTLIWMPGDIVKGTYVVRVSAGGQVTEERLIWQ